MRATSVLLPLISLGLAVPNLAAQEAAAVQDTTQQTVQLSVAEAIITSNVVDRVPADTLTAVAADVGQVYCWTRITGAEGEVEINHVWYRGEDEVARTSLRVASADWRTWSSKKIDPSWTGEWRVEVIGPDGTVLKTISFTVG